MFGERPPIDGRPFPQPMSCSGTEKSTADASDFMTTTFERTVAKSCRSCKTVFHLLSTGASV